MNILSIVSPLFFSSKPAPASVTSILSDFHRMVDRLTTAAETHRHAANVKTETAAVLLAESQDHRNEAGRAIAAADKLREIIG